MNRHTLRWATLAVVLAVWAIAMIHWIFIEHVAPDPIAWGVPQGIWLVLFPNGARNRGEDDE